MVEIYTLSMKSNSYKELSKKVISMGDRSKITRFLRHQSLGMNMSAIESDYVALPKIRANGAESSIKYALAETVWYASQQLKTKLIAKFGPIWKKMEDSKGLVNSNYGHQIFRNQDFDQKLAELVENKQVRFLIASDENQKSRTDLVCNNAVDIYLNEDKIEVRVVARSIDLIFGYPYDVFAAQLFVRYVQKKLLEKYSMTTEFTNLRFDIENVHIYNKDIEFDETIIDRFDDEEFILISANEIFEMLVEVDFSNITDKNVAAIREHLAEKSFVVRRPEINSQQTERIEHVMYRDAYLPHLKRRVLEDLTTEKSVIDQFDRVVEFLNADKHDRKNLVKIGEKLLYLSRVTCGFGTAQYEVTIYEL